MYRTCLPTDCSCCVLHFVSQNRGGKKLPLTFPVVHLSLWNEWSWSSTVHMWQRGIVCDSLGWNWCMLSLIGSHPFKCLDEMGEFWGGENSFRPIMTQLSSQTIIAWPMCHIDNLKTNRIRMQFTFVWFFVFENASLYVAAATVCYVLQNLNVKQNTPLECPSDIFFPCLNLSA